MPRQARCNTVNWNWTEFLHDEHVRAMSSEALGLFIRLLGAMSLAERPGFLRGDESAVRRACEADTEEWVRCRDSILATLDRAGDGWYHRRTIKDYKLQTERVNKSHERLSKAREAKRVKSLEASMIGPVTALFLPSVLPSFLESKSKDLLTDVSAGPSAIASNGQNSSAKADPSFDGFEMFWSAYPRKAGRKAAVKAWVKTGAESDAILFREIMEGLGRVSPGWTDPKFTPHASTFLNGERWKDDTGKPEADDPFGDLPADSIWRQLDDRNKPSPIREGVSGWPTDLPDKYGGAK